MFLNIFSIFANNVLILYLSIVNVVQSLLCVHVSTKNFTYDILKLCKNEMYGLAGFSEAHVFMSIVIVSLQQLPSKTRSRHVSVTSWKGLCSSTTVLYTSFCKILYKRFSTKIFNGSIYIHVLECILCVNAL